MKNRHSTGRIFIYLVILAAIIALFVYRINSNYSDYRADVKNVIIIVVDTLRYDRLGCSGYHADTSPNIDNLADRSITCPSFTSILTGLHVINHLVHENYQPWPDDIHSLTPVFSENGYETWSLMAAGILEADFGFGQGINHYFNPDNPADTFDAQHQVDSAIDILSDTDQPLWMMLHFWESHGPYAPSDEALQLLGLPTQYPNPDIDGSIEMAERYNARSGIFTAEDVQRVSDLYDGEIRQMDLALGDLFAFLENNGYFNNSIIIFTADHGEAMGEDHTFGHGNDSEEQLHIPLLIHFPGDRGAGTRIEGLVENTDISPTILDILDLPCPRVDGQSLLPRIKNPELPGRSILLSTDFHMYFSLWDGQWRRGIDREIVLNERELTPEEIEALRSLGYLGN